MTIVSGRKILCLTNVISVVYYVLSVLLLELNNLLFLVCFFFGSVLNRFEFVCHFIGFALLTWSIRISH